jgi:Cellulose binding domain
VIFTLVGAKAGPGPLGLGDRPATQATPAPRQPPGAGPAESGQPSPAPGAPEPTGAAGPGSTADPTGPPGAVGGLVPGGVAPVYNAAPTPRPADPPEAAEPTPAPPAPAPARVPLTARYAAAEAEGLLGYRATVTITNPGRASHSGWALVIRLPATALAVTDVSGATVSRSGATWTFTPTPDTRTVPAGESVRVRYLVRDAPLLSGAPKSCTIDGAPCGGLH